MQYRVHDFISR